ncbi:MAG: B12-binding domain-containing radical SAM protein [Methanobacteriaceae archaeon]|nr:B12-binding domain-containing radical SAM protein [Methanobacteriaceae archaeon]
MKILFVEPPKEFWFVMGEYLPPPLGILQLAAFLEDKGDNWDLEVLDCQAERVNWKNLERRLESSDPDLVITSALATCNTYTILRTISLVKKIDPDIKTVVGGQHFTALAQESLEKYPEIDFVVRGEGELTLLELVKNLEKDKTPYNVRGLSYRRLGKVVHNPPRPLIHNLDDLPLPGYHFIADHAHKYHFKMMANQGDGYAMVEASRGCQHKCTFCSQWNFWGGQFRTKSPGRVVDEMEHLYQDYGISFLWLTDDNLGLGPHTRQLCDELIKRDLSEDLKWFVQARSDAVIKNQELLPKLRKAGNYWVMAGLERHDRATINSYKKNIKIEDSRLAMRLLKDNDIFAQATFITGDRSDSHQSMQEFREFVNHVEPDLAIFMILTPFPGTALFETAHREGWLEDYNWSNYDMTHAVMPTEHLTRSEVQEELYQCYRDFYGSLKRRVTGVFSKNQFKRMTYRYMASQGLLQSLRDLV